MEIRDQALPNRSCSPQVRAVHVHLGMLQRAGHPGIEHNQQQDAEEAQTLAAHFVVVEQTPHGVVAQQVHLMRGRDKGSPATKSDGFKLLCSLSLVTSFDTKIIVPRCVLCDWHPTGLLALYPSQSPYRIPDKGSLDKGSPDSQWTKAHFIAYQLLHLLTPRHCPKMGFMQLAPC